MNIKLLTLATAVAVSAAVAQDYDEYEESTTEASSEAVQEESEPEPAPVATAPQVAPQTTPVFQEPAPVEQPAAAPAQGLNVLHGNAYNMVGNEAAASTIGGDMNAIYKMNGRKLIYVEPSDQYGALALGSGSMTYLLAFDNSNGLGMLTAGLAMKSFGVAVDVALDKRWESREQETANTKSTKDASTTNAGDIFALRIGALLGNLDLTARLYWLTYQTETDTETDDNGAKVDHDEDYWTLGADLALSNGPSAKGLAWSVGVNFFRHTDWEKDSQGNQSREVTGEDAYIQFQPFFNLGTPVFQTASANVFLGLNTFAPIRLYDEIENGAGENTETNNRNSISLYTSPNILGEMAINENWIVFAGATYLWNVFSRSATTIEQGKNTDETSIITMRTNSTMANGGLRFQYNNLIVEASIADDLGSQSWSGLVGNLGVFLTF